MPGTVYFGSKSISGAGEEEFFGTLSDSILLRNLTQQAAMIYTMSKQSNDNLGEFTYPYNFMPTNLQEAMITIHYLNSTIYSYILNLYMLHK